MQKEMEISKKKWFLLIRLRRRALFLERLDRQRCIVSNNCILQIHVYGTDYVTLFDGTSCLQENLTMEEVQDRASFQQFVSRSYAQSKHSSNGVGCKVAICL